MYSFVGFLVSRTTAASAFFPSVCGTSHRRNGDAVQKNVSTTADDGERKGGAEARPRMLAQNEIADGLSGRPYSQFRPRSVLPELSFVEATWLLLFRKFDCLCTQETHAYSFVRAHSHIFDRSL